MLFWCCSLTVFVCLATRLVMCVQQAVRISPATKIMCGCVSKTIPKSMSNRYHFDLGVRPNRPIALSVPSRTEANRTRASSRRITASVLNHDEGSRTCAMSKLCHSQSGSAMARISLCEICWPILDTRPPLVDHEDSYDPHR